MLPALITINPAWEQARGGKSPWNVSKTATERVPPDQRLPPPEVCPYCGGACRVKHHEEVYGMPYGDWPWMYGCTQCDATVGMHGFTCIPLGSLANKELRTRRIAAKEHWKLLCFRQDLNRTQGYAWLAGQLKIHPSDCHFGRFDLDTCDLVLVICKTNLEKNK